MANYLMRRALMDAIRVPLCTRASSSSTELAKVTTSSSTNQISSISNHMSEYLDDEALLSIFFVNFLQINPSKINLLPPKPPLTKFHESCWRLNR